ncbi:lambda exonuclease family protein [Methylobacterium sp. Leaf118]|uniref:lambda exonuclease family protein n=1 Tax=Methylobacterium sp. Leaf118 TaxID=2876562 RepID=UPI001E48E9ED|nr:lambda exonuclease family protein [Methylobacterium sp. Leaf118]
MSTLRILDCEQGSPEWFSARAGLPTASEFATILAKGRDGGASKTRRAYMMRLAGELLTGEIAETYTNGHMERGKALEPEARNLYAFQADVDPQQVGFVVNGSKGCSPDSLIGDRGALEIKTKLPALLIDCLLRDEFPAEHKAQCQGVLWVAEREWIDIAVYWPRLPLFVKRAHRDEAYIAGLSSAVDAFNDELAEMVERVRRYGIPAEAVAA